MLAKLSLAASLALAAAALASTGAAATTAAQSPIPGVLAANGSLVQKAQYRRCRAWRHECAARWGWRSRQYFRCVNRHGC